MSSPTVGWSTAGKRGRLYCPVHRPPPAKEIELLPITLADAQAADLTCCECDELLAEVPRPYRRRSS